MNQRKENNGSWWGGILMGLMFSFLGSYGILTGKLYLSKENIPIPAWTGWVQLPFGIWVLFLSIRAWWRN